MNRDELKKMVQECYERTPYDSFTYQLKGARLLECGKKYIEANLAEWLGEDYRVGFEEIDGFDYIMIAKYDYPFTLPHLIHLIPK